MGSVRCLLHLVNNFIARIVPFFNRLAHEKVFHPVKEHEEWYNIRESDVAGYKVG